MMNDIIQYVTQHIHTRAFNYYFFTSMIMILQTYTRENKNHKFPFTMIFCVFKLNEAPQTLKRSKVISCIVCIKPGRRMTSSTLNCREYNIYIFTARAKDAPVSVSLLTKHTTSFQQWPFCSSHKQVGS